MNSILLDRVLKKLYIDLEIEIFLIVLSTLIEYTTKMDQFYGSVYFTKFGDSSYTCNLCKLSLGDNELAKTHFEKDHAKSAPFICDMCLKTFTLQSALTTHLKSHKNLPEVQL